MFDPIEPLLLDLSETDTDVAAEVTFVPELGDTLVSLAFEHDLPVNFTVLKVGDVIHVTAATVAGAFPVLGIDYLQDGVQGTVYSFNDLPEEAEEIISYRKSPLNAVDYELEVTATTTLGVVETLTYTIHIETNCDIGRDALIAAVNARR